MRRMLFIISSLSTLLFSLFILDISLDVVEYTLLGKIIIGISTILSVTLMLYTSNEKTYIEYIKGGKK